MRSSAAFEPVAWTFDRNEWYRRARVARRGQEGNIERKRYQSTRSIK